MTNMNLQQQDEQQEQAADLLLKTKSDETAVQTLANALTHPHPTTQLLLSGKTKMHRPEAGLNSLVDAAATVFSTMGRLKHVKSCPDLAGLHEELVHEIEQYRETVQMCNHDEQYLTEYIPITCYALCATLDDVIASTTWGGQGKWNDYSLVTSFNQEALSQKSFFIILERLVRDPDIYIDVMEFMYICLSLGFRCHFNTPAAEFDQEQLEQIVNSLYKRIRSYRGSTSKMLSPFSVRPPQPSVRRRGKTWLAAAAGCGILCCGLLGTFMLTGKWMLNKTYIQTAHYVAKVSERIWTA